MTSKLIPDDHALRRLVDRLPDPVFVKDREHRWIYLNDACCAFIGYPREKLIGMSDPDIFPKEQCEVFWERDNHVFETGECDHNVEEFTDATGVLHTIATRKSRVELANGTPLLIGVIRDVTHARQREKQNEAALFAAQEELNSIMNSAPVMIVTFDQDGQVTLVRGKVGGFDEQALRAMNACQMAATSEPLRDAFMCAGAGKKASALVEQNGHTYEVQVVPRYGARNQLVGGISVWHDVTELQKLQRRLMQTEKMDSMGRLARGVAHDFNNLLTIIQSSLDIAELASQKPEANGRLGKSLKTVRDAADRAARLTRQLLSLAKEHVVRKERVDLNALIDNIQDLLQRVVGDHVSLDLDLDSEACWAVVDPAQLEQVMINLCINASQAMSNGGTVRIATRRKDHQFHASRAQEPAVELIVSDTGSGMDAPTLERIFEPLFTTRKDGTGIGLSICRSIISELGGEINVQSELNQGARFSILVPAESSEISEFELSAMSFSFKKTNASVLLVDDDAVLRAAVAQGLQEFGYHVHVADNGESAMAVVLSDVKIDIVVTDVVMPNMSGPQFVAWLAGRMPSIFVTGYADDVLIRHGLAHPETDFLHKPYSIAQLHQKIVEVLGRKLHFTQTQTGAVAEFGG